MNCFINERFINEQGQIVVGNENILKNCLDILYDLQKNKHPQKEPLDWPNLRPLSKYQV